MAGLSAARDRGRVGGRPSSLTAAKKRQANKMRGDGVSMTEIAEVLNVARSTLYRNLQRENSFDMKQRVLGYPKCTLNCLAGFSSQLTRGSYAVGWKLPLSEFFYGQSKWIRKIAFPQVKPVTEGGAIVWWR
ncbi:helix-turn-helix domain-containing protein [Rhodococcus sp. NPDC055024]